MIGDDNSILEAVAGAVVLIMLSAFLTHLPPNPIPPCSSINYFFSCRFERGIGDYRV